MKGHIIEHSKAIDFILGGKSLFTCLNTNSNNRFTFKVKKHKTDDIYFVSVLTNPDIYQYIGMVKNQEFSNTKKIPERDLLQTAFSISTSAMFFAAG